MTNTDQCKIIFKGTIEISQGDIKERLPIKIVSSSEEDNFIQSVQFFRSHNLDCRPKKFKHRLKFVAKSICEYLNNLNSGE